MPLPSTVPPDIAWHLAPLHDGNPKLGELLHLSVGRVLANAARAGEDWRMLSLTNELEHIRDWLLSSILEENRWLSIVDSMGRPRKLMKFGNIDGIMAEADKAMLKASQKLAGVKVTGADESLVATLAEGFSVVRLLTPSALDAESATMQHCIGQGAYDKALEDPNRCFLSLRSPSGKSHATLEIFGNSIRQLQGKQNVIPVDRYLQLLKPFIRESGYGVEVPAYLLGYAIDTEGEWHDVKDLPDGLTVPGDLALIFPRLPSGMTVGRNLYITGMQIDRLPPGLTVNGDLYAGSTMLSSLPDDLAVHGGISLEGTRITELPDGFKVSGWLDLTLVPITRLPKGLDVSANLRLYGTAISTLPPDLKVGGDLDIQQTLVMELPSNLEIGGDANFYMLPIAKLPEGLKVGGDLDLRGTKVTELPESLQAGGLYLNGRPVTRLPSGLTSFSGALDISSTLITELPQDLFVGGLLNVSDTPMTELPEGLVVGKEIYLNGTGVVTLPESIGDGTDVYKDNVCRTARGFRRYCDQARSSAPGP